ncbi:MAG TPA: PilZ domain-containing protein [Xanthobacteraceae bacterium]|nr:PilZ domain-containing protein [Xanthobacteraceae bacterium]
MNGRRASRRQKSFLRGVVYFDKRRSETACLVRDLSEDGARIVLSQTITIPDVIELQIPQREQTLSARVQWRRADEVGLSFSKPDTATTPRENQLIKRIAELEAEITTLQRTIKRLKRDSNGDGGIEAA